MPTFAEMVGKRPKDEERPRRNLNTGDYLFGALESTLSGVPELFGENASEGAQEFRRENPVSGFVTEMLPFVAGGAASTAVSKIPRVAGAIEGTLGRMGLGAESGSTILRPAMKYGVLEQIPFEIGRAAVGTVTAPEENVGDLWASSMTSLAAGGVLTGALGGLMKAGGRQIKDPSGQLVGSVEGLAPTWTLRQARQVGPEAEWVKGSHEQNLKHLEDEVIFETPDTIKGKTNYSGKMTNATDEGSAGINRMFKLNEDPVDGVDIRNWHEGPSKKSLNDGEREALLTKSLLDDTGDLAASVRFPRVVSAVDDAGAAKLHRIFEKEGGLTHASDDTWVGYNEDGMSVIAKRLVRGPMQSVTKGKNAGQVKAGYGAHHIRPGDRFLFGLTDDPGKFAPGADKLAKGNISAFAKMRSGYRPGVQNDAFSDIDDNMLKHVSEQDIDKLRTMKKQDWIREKAKDLTKKMPQYEGVEIGEQAMHVANKLYDWFAPTQAKVRSNKLYSRLYASASQRSQRAESLASRAVMGKASMPKWGKVEYGEGLDGFGSVRSIIKDLDADEKHFLQVVGNNFASRDDIARLVPEEFATPNLYKAYDQLQELDQHLINKYFLQTFRGTADEKRFVFEKNFVMPNMLKGQWSATVRDESGDVLYNVAGKDRGDVIGQVDEILGEAKKAGQNWSMDKPEARVQKGMDEIGDLFAKMQENLAKAKGEDVAGIVYKGIKNYQSKMFSKVSKGAAGSGAKRRAFGPLTARSNVEKGAPASRRFTENDILESNFKHRKQLFNFAGQYGFRERYGGAIAQLNKQDPLLKDDILRKSDQFLGIEGRHSQAINSAVSKVLGPMLGGKAGTTIANVTNRMMYDWNIGMLNPTHAVVNMLSPLMVTAPAIAKLMNMSDEMVHNLAFVGPRIGADGKVKGMMSWLDPMKLTFSGMRDLAKPGAELKEFWGRGVEDGVFGSGMDTEILGSGSRMGARLKDIYASKGAWAASEAGLTMMASKSEEFARGVAFNAAYRLGQGMGYTGDDLYRFTVKAYELGSYGYKQTQRSRAITGPVGSVFGLFKNFQIHYIDNMCQYFMDGVKGQGWSPLLWQQGSTLAVGGLGASPLVNLADGMAKWFTDQPTSYAWMQNNWSDMQDGEGGNAASDALYFGFGGIMGTSLQSSVMSPGTDIANDIASFGNIVLWERMKALGTAMGTSYDYMEQTGENPMANQRIRDEMLNASMPRMVIRAMATTEGEYIKSMQSGYARQRDVDLGDRVKYFMGFTPTETAEHMLVQKQAWKETDKRREAITMYGRLVADAWVSNDFEAMDRAYRDAMAANVPLDSISKSARNVYRRQMYGDALSRYDPALIDELEGQGY